MYSFTSVPYLTLLWQSKDSPNHPQRLPPTIGNQLRLQYAPTPVQKHILWYAWCPQSRCKEPQAAHCDYLRAFGSSSKEGGLGVPVCMHSQSTPSSWSWGRLLKWYVIPLSLLWLNLTCPRDELCAGDTFAKATEWAAFMWDGRCGPIDEQDITAGFLMDGALIKVPHI